MTLLIAAAALAAACSGCGSTTEPAPATPSSTAVAHGADCVVHAPGPTSIDGAFTDVPGFTVQPICATDVSPLLASNPTQFAATNAGQISKNGKPIVKVFVATLKSGDGEAFGQSFLEALSSKAAPKKLASETRDAHGYQATFFNVPAEASGYLYVDGPTAVIGFDVGGGGGASAEDAFTTILANLFTSG